MTLASGGYLGGCIKVCTWLGRMEWDGRLCVQVGKLYSFLLSFFFFFFLLRVKVPHLFS